MRVVEILVREGDRDTLALSLHGGPIRLAVRVAEAAADSSAEADR